jgi:hypothetical protein
LARKFIVLLRLVSFESHELRRWLLLMSRSVSVVTSMPARLLRKVSWMMTDLAFSRPGVPKVRVSRALSEVHLTEPTLFSEVNESDDRPVRLVSRSSPVIELSDELERPVRRPLFSAMKSPLTSPRPGKSTVPTAPVLTRMLPLNDLQLLARAVASAGELMVAVDCVHWEF